jgi:hypothetical protein
MQFLTSRFRSPSFELKGEAKQIIDHSFPKVKLPQGQEEELSSCSAPSWLPA